MLDPPLIPTEFVIKYIREMMINFVKKKNLSVALAQAAWGQNPSHPRRNPPHPPPSSPYCHREGGGGESNPDEATPMHGRRGGMRRVRRPAAGVVWRSGSIPLEARSGLPAARSREDDPDGGGPVEVRGHARKGVHDEKAPCEESMVMDGTTRRAEMDGVGDGCTTRPAARRGQRRRQHGGHRDLRS